MELTVSFKCGETMCHSEPGVWCRFLKFTRFGTIPICNLFETELEQTMLGVVRCDECRNLE